MFRTLKQVFLFSIFFSFFTLFAGEDYSFELYTMKDKLVSTTEIMHNPEAKYLVVDFFSLMCEPCKRSLPKWDEFYKENKSKGFEFLLVSLPIKGEGKKYEKALKDYFKKNVFSFKMVFDKYSVVGKKFGAVTKDDDVLLPMIFVLDKSGQIVFKALSYEEAVSKISTLK